MSKEKFKAGDRIIGFFGTDSTHVYTITDINVKSPFPFSVINNSGFENQTTSDFIYNNFIKISDLSQLELILYVL